jgi:hypothetical protein
MCEGTIPMINYIDLGVDSGARADEGADAIYYRKCLQISKL